MKVTVKAYAECRPVIWRQKEFGVSIVRTKTAIRLEHFLPTLQEQKPNIGDDSFLFDSDFTMKYITWDMW